MVSKASQKQVMHYPRLDTILMIEKAIENAEDEMTRTELWKSLPRKVMYQTFQVVLDYLEKSNKIVITNKGLIVWVWDPEGVERALKHRVR